MIVSRHTAVLNGNGHEIKTTWRIGQLTAYLFRRWFGRAPDKHFWPAPGNCSLAEDKRGNRITLEQVNWPSKALVPYASDCHGPGR